MPPFFFVMMPPLPRSTLFPYTTLFRSVGLFSLPLIQLPGIELEDTADERRRIAPSHVRSGEAELVGYWLSRVFAGCAPSLDRKSTRLNSSHLGISYAVFCLKKKKKKAS